jgi:hypothetical protein
MTKKNKKTKSNYSLFIFHFSLLLMFTSVVSADFTRDNTKQIVTDNETGLQWQDNESATKTWQNAIDYCEALTLGDYNDWRLPNINELNSLVDDSKYSPSMSPVFESFASFNYWSSTTVANYSDNAWIVNVSYGHQYSYYFNYDSNYVRGVRAGQ